MKRLFWLTLALILVPSPSHAYVDISSSLGEIIREATTITLLEVQKVSQEKRVIVFKKLTDLKGKDPDAVLRHHIADGLHPREPRAIMEWAEPGKRAVCFTTGKACAVCIGRYWYEGAALEGPWWTMTTGSPEMGLAFFGPAEKLADAVADILAGKEVVVPAIKHGSQAGVMQYSNVAFQKVLRGKDCPVWRIKASLKMPSTAMEVAVKDSPWLVGPGYAGPEDVPGFVRALQDKDGRVRAQAADDLGLIGWSARSALPQLLRGFQDADPLVRIHAARAVAFITEEYAAPVHVLQEVLKNSEPRVRKAAAEALGDLGGEARAAVPALRDALRDADPAVRWSVAETLGRIGPAAAAAVGDLAEALRDPATRVIAAEALGGVGPASRGAVPLLKDALKDKDVEFCWTAARALARIDARAARQAVPLFADKIAGDDFRARWDAMHYIMPMGTEAKAAAPAVRLRMANGNGIAAGTLANILGPDAVDALPLLFYVLADDWDSSADIARVGAAAVPGLIAILKDPEATNKHLALKSLGLLARRVPDAIPPLSAALEIPDPALRIAAAKALGSVGPRVKEAVPGLNALLKDEDPTVRLEVAAALRAILGSEASHAVPVLTDLLANKNATIRRDAAAVLADFGATAARAVPALNEAQKDADAGVRSAAAWATARITAAEASQRAVAVMVAALKDKEPRSRLDAVRFLGMVGPDARDAVAALTAARQDDSEEVRRAAAAALAKIQAR